MLSPPTSQRCCPGWLQIGAGARLLKDFHVNQWNPSSSSARLNSGTGLCRDGRVGNRHGESQEEMSSSAVLQLSTQGGHARLGYPGLSLDEEYGLCFGLPWP